MRKSISKLLNGIKKRGLSKYLISNNLEGDSRIFTHMTLNELICLHRLVKRSGGKKINAVEIGSYLGASSCFISNAIGNDSKLYCIDTWGNDAMKYIEGDTDAEKRDTYKEFRNNTEIYRDKIVEIRKWSTEAIADVKHIVDKVDFLFIDGDHNYEGVKMDWDLYSPLLCKGALIAFHDTGWADGVKRVIKEDVAGKAVLLKKLPNLEVYRIV